MYNEIFTRQILLLGEENQEKIKNTKVAIFGVGGVGSYTLEALARNGVNNIVLGDRDIVDISNVNRQLVAYTTTVGEKKIDVAKRRILEINPEINMHITDKNIQTEEDLDQLFSKTFKPDYIVDAVDDVNAKISIIRYAVKNNIKIITSTGAGNRTKPWLTRIDTIYKTKNCPLARRLRKELKEVEKQERQKVRNAGGTKLKFNKVMAVYSEEIPKKAHGVTTSLVENTSVFGLFMGAYIINDICGIKL